MSIPTHANENDTVLARLAALPSVPAPDELSRSILAAAHAKLRPRALHPVWSIAVAGATVSYLSSALYFVSRLQGLR